MNIFKRIGAVSLATIMVLGITTPVTAAKNAQTGSKSSVIVSSEMLTIPMIKENGKWKIDPLFSYIGIKNIKATSKITNFSINYAKKLKVIPKTYFLKLTQTGTIIPNGETTKTPNITVKFWVYGKDQKDLYTSHKVTLKFVKRESPIKTMKIGANYFDTSTFDIANTAKFYRKQNWAWRSLNVILQPYYKNLKLVAIGKDGHNWVIRSTSGNSLKNCAVNLKTIKAIQIRYTVDRTIKGKYYNYLKSGVNIPSTGCLTLNIK